ncbi:MAG: formylmethanofuran dehydrogenase [Proteobacteria bacterium]|nr:formylmethanofuran dehydrogenase [Pseudomonadota bacterium]MBU1456282.1 formylmethanofuran dehydrogenase [Pseudomonadota bacterium]
MKKNKKFRQLLDEAAAFHGHLCNGQIVGVRMAMCGLSELGIADPLGADRKKLVVFVEVARCFADAIMTVTGCRVGKRSFKIVDNGKVAATFLDMTTGRAVRIGLRTDLLEKIALRYSGLAEKVAEKSAYSEMTDNELFSAQEVKVLLKDEDTPGTPMTKVRCMGCGELVLDKREIHQDDRVYCPSCGIGQTYYTLQSEIPELTGRDFFNE